MSSIINFNLVKIFSLPLILYMVLIGFRVNGLQPTMEGQLGDFITALNFLFGSFISYFIFIFYILSPHKLSKGKSIWWWLMCMLLAIMAFDELFMIHENIGYFLDTSGTGVLLFYGLLLGLLLMFDLKETFVKETFVFLLLFLFFALLSQGADYFYGEGLIVLMGKNISYEQFGESFGALSLSCAVITMAVRQLVSKEPSLA